MTALTDALAVAQARAVAAISKSYVAGTIDQEEAVERLAGCGVTDPVDTAYLLACLDVARELGTGTTAVNGGDFGDDVAANLVPLCGDCHADLHNRNGQVCRLFVANLSDDEYAYAVTKAGEDYLERVYGIEYKP